MHIRWLRCVFSLQKILGVESLDELLDRQCVNPLNIIHNMTKVNKHGVVTLEDKTSRFYSWKRHRLVLLLIISPASCLSVDDLPHWVLNAMKSLANCEYCALLSS